MTERLNIRRMQVPESTENTLTFDPERDINTEKWEKLEEAFQADVDRKGGRFGFGHVAAMATNIQLLGKTARIDDATLKKISDDVEKSNREPDSELPFMLSREFVLLKTRGIDTPMSEKLWEKFRSRAKWAIRASSNTVELDIAAIIDLAILSPDKLEFNDEDISEILQEMDRQRNLVKSRDWFLSKFAALGALLKIIRPRALQLTREDWGYMRNSLFDKPHVESSFLADAACMALLAADKVRITDSGIEVKQRSAATEEKNRPQPSSIEL